jgi:hypothetical protein
MITPETPPPTLRPAETISSDEDYERLDRALRNLSDDQWVYDFIKRLNYVIEKSSTKNQARPPPLRRVGGLHR